MRIDALWVDECFNDIYDILPHHKRNNKITLLHRSNQSNLVAVKTPAGLSERVNMPSIIQQGGVWGSLMCSNTIDSIGRKRQLRGEHIYLYKNRTEVLPLAFVDDLNGIARCGKESRLLNIYLNSQIELKKLRFHTGDSDGVDSKCVRMHVGKRLHPCPTLTVHDKEMLSVSEITYLGDKVSADGRNTINVKDRIRKGMGLMGKVLKLVKSLGLGTFTMEILLLLRNSFFIYGMLTNAEVWQNITKAEVDEFDKIDKTFLHKILGVPKSVFLVQ